MVMKQTKYKCPYSQQVMSNYIDKEYVCCNYESGRGGEHFKQQCIVFQDDLELFCPYTSKTLTGVSMRGLLDIIAKEFREGERKLIRHRSDMR